MGTLVDFLFNKGSIRAPNSAWGLENIKNDFRDSLEKAEVIVAKNVSDYYFTSKQEKWAFPDDFPCLIPPFKTCVVECARPERAFIEDSVESRTVARGYPKRWMVLFETIDLPDLLPLGKERAKAKFGFWKVYMLGQLMESFISGTGINTDVNDTRPVKLVTDASDPDAQVHLKIQLDPKSPLVDEVEENQQFDMGSMRFVAATLFSSTNSPWLAGTLDKSTDKVSKIFEDDSAEEFVAGPLGTWAWLVDKYGYVVNAPVWNILASKTWVDQLPGTEEEKNADIENYQHVLSDLFSATLFWPAFLAISFLHCKNVTIADNKPPRHERRQAEREGKKAPVTFKTLVIEPMKKVLRTEGNSEETGIKQAIHICRGHFKDYRGSNKGLFGKYKGLYWWDAHLAGSPEHGSVVKEYEELAPKQKG